MATKKTVSVGSPVKMPISFKEFSKEPVKGLMFICIVAVAYLYIDIKMTNTSDKKALNQRITTLETKLESVTESLRRSDSTLSAAASKIAVLQELGKIK